MLEKGAWGWHISENLLFVDDGNLLKFCQSGQLCDFNESNKSKWHFSIVWLNLFLQTMLIDYGWIGLLVVCPMLMTQEWRFLTLWVQLVLAMMIVYHWKELITCNQNRLLVHWVDSQAGRRFRTGGTHWWIITEEKTVHSRSDLKLTVPMESISKPWITATVWKLRLEKELNSGHSGSFSFSWTLGLLDQVGDQVLWVCLQHEGDKKDISLPVDRKKMKYNTCSPL